MTDLLEICIIELPKVHKYNENKDLDTWVSIDFIMEVTDLSKEKIEFLKDCDE